MKLIKGLGLLSFVAIGAGSCFDPPEFPVVPQIEYERVEFIDAQDPSEFDTLNLYINFKDGDGDLGFNDGLPDISEPYHSAFFYQENDGEIEPLSTVSLVDNTNAQYDLLLIPDPSKGKLVTFRTHKKPEYAFLPGGDVCTGSNSLKYYEYLAGAINPDNSLDGRRMIIEANDRAALDAGVQLVDSFPRTNPEYYQIRDTLYYTPNPNHYNIEVDFLVKDPLSGEFNEFDWREEYCTTFDGRFPVFSDKQSSIDGTLRYTMTSLGFTTIFSIQTLKLRVSIKDRAGHQSNIVETQEFTLH